MIVSGANVRLESLDDKIDGDWIEFVVDKELGQDCPGLAADHHGHIAADHGVPVFTVLDAWA
ncbi:MAG: hypothetical protein ACRDYF_05170, partial [Acidimicrobiia bacterium]